MITIRSIVKKLKTGKFYYYTKKSRERINVLRKDSLQLEIGAKDTITIKSRIIWKSDCDYDMYLNPLSGTKLTEFDSLIASTPAHVRIIYIGRVFYVCTVIFNFPDKEIQLQIQFILEINLFVRSFSCLPSESPLIFFRTKLPCGTRGDEKLSL